jgi:hypothetical protein
MKDADVQRRVRRAMSDLVAGDAETGVQVAVIKDGRTVADVCAVAADTLFSPHRRRACRGCRRTPWWRTD